MIKTILATCLSSFTVLLPYLIKIVVYLIEKKKDNEKLKEEVLKFVEAIQDDLPIKLHDKHAANIERLKKRIEENNAKDIKIDN
jgi:hypothetical protein